MNRRTTPWGSLVALFLAACWLPAHAAPDDAAIQRVSALNDQIQQLYDQRLFQQALPLAQEVLDIRERALGPTHLDVAEALDQLAALHTAIDAQAKAESLYQRALAIRTRLLGATNPKTARSLYILAELYRRGGDYAKAEQMHKRALAIREKVLGPEHLDTDASLSRLGLVYLATADYAKAESLLQRSLAIRKATLGSEHVSTGRAMESLARIYTASGAYTKAEPLMQQAVVIDEKVLGPDHHQFATSLTNLANIYFFTGALTKAEPLYRRALAIYDRRGEGEEAASAAVLTNLGAVYSRMRAYDRALPLLERAIEIRKKTSGADQLINVDAISNLAITYERIGRYEQAEVLFERALSIKQQALGVSHPSVGSSLDDLAELYRQSGAYARAEPLHHQAVATLEKSVGLEHRLTVYALRRLAATQWALGNTAQALSTFERSQKAETKNTDRFLLTGSESRKQAYLQARNEEISMYISFSVAAATADAAAFGLSTVLRYKGRVEDAMSDSVARSRRDMKGQGREVLERLAEVAARLSTLAYQGPGRFADAYREQMEQLTHQQEDLEAELARRSSEFRRQMAPVTIEAVQRHLPKDTVLVEWFRYPVFDPKATAVHGQPRKSRYVAYVLKPAGAPVVLDVGDAQPIEAAVQGFSAALRSPRRAGLAAATADLSERLLARLRPHLLGAERVLMSPDGALNLVPMAALLDERGEYLVRSLEISYLTSGRDLLRLASKSAAQSAPVILGSPAYGELSGLPVDLASSNMRSADLDGSELRFRPLLETALEAQALQALMKLADSNVLIGSRASETRLKQLHAPRILHIATHGFFLQDQESASDAPSLPENPLLRSGLALAGANQRRSGKDDGILTALEAARLDLQGTELVVLSACESGLGEIKNGEGVYGLRRALVLAGAQAQVTSLWKVSDAATRELMVGYYERLLQGEGRAAALRNVQRRMLADSSRSHPYYWAGFFASGNWRPLPTP